MSLEVVEERINPLLGRREVRLVVNHSGQGTPDRLSIRKLASQHYKTGVEQVYVRSIATRTGGSSAICKVEVYDKPEMATRNVPGFLKNRNLPKDQRVSKGKKSESAPAAAPTPPAAKPKAAPAAPAPPAESAQPAAKPKK